MTGQFRGGAGEPLVLIHGFSNSWHVWKPVLPPLTERYDVLAATLAGHHEGVPLEEGIEATVDALADVIERQMDAEGFETAHLVGNSLGGWLALELARRGRARSVVALAPAGGWKQGSKAERRLRRLFTLGYRIVTLVDPHAERIVRRPRLRRLLLGSACAHPERVSPEDAVRRIRAMVGCTIYWDFIAMARRDGPPAWLSEVQAPVLLAWPERDRIIPAKRYSALFVEQLPNVEYRELPGVGHVPMSDDPELVVDTIVEFTELTSAVATAAGP